MSTEKIRDISGGILAGGKNTRYPIIKSFLKIDDSTIIERTLGLFKNIFDEVFISTNTPEIYFKFQSPLLGDIINSKGPMSGIYTSLININNNCLFAVACDMPFLKDSVISFICKKHKEASKNLLVDATIPIFNGRPQPLMGIYCKSVIFHLQDLILKEKTSMKRFLEEINTYYIDEEEIKDIDPEGKSFLNINTPEDYEIVIKTVVT
jgi:molybdopterin-guanine dinucleotide biosynthesis protein A